MLTQFDSFNVIGTWGTSPNVEDLNIQGTLKYSTDELSLSLYTPGQVNVDNLIYGIGVVSGKTKDGENYQFQTKISLSGIITTKRSGMVQLDTGLTTHYYEYAPLEMYVGDTFVTESTKFSEMNVKLTNFPEWIANERPKIDYGKDDSVTATLSTKNSARLIETDRNTYKIITIFGNETRFNISRLNYNLYVSSSIQITHKDSIEVTAVNFNRGMLANWFSLLSNNTQYAYQVTCLTESNKIPVSYFVRDGVKNAKKIDYSFVASFINRSEDWFENMQHSLELWANKYDGLVPIFKAISLNQIGTLEQQLQGMCKTLQLIFDLNYDHEYRKQKRLHKKDKITYCQAVTTVLNQLPDQLVDQVVNTQSNANRDAFITEIVRMRNVLSHSSMETEGKWTKSQEYKMQAGLRLLIRDWLLSQIGISRKYLDMEYQIESPLNVSVTSSEWHS